MAMGAGQVEQAIANFTTDYNSKVACDISLINTIQNSAVRSITAIAPNPLSGAGINTIVNNEIARISQLSAVIVAAINDEITELNLVLELDP
jgi:hypothetical protein